TSSLSRAAVTGPPPCSGWRSRDCHPEQGGSYRTTALFKAAVTRLPPRQGGGF
ncbi:hypothetical protein KI387_037288, partial [Taxus chinensis]